MKTFLCLFILFFTCNTGVEANPFTIGQNFTGDTLSNFTDSSAFIPPDTMGAVGPSYIVEFTNDNYLVYNKSGTLAQSVTIDNFWNNIAGVNTSSTFDPRVVYDRASSRWFAAAVDQGTVGNNFLLAVSNSANPLDGWKGLALPVNSNGTQSVDFPSLGLNANGVYLAANMYNSGSTIVNNVNVVSIPKADLLLPVPTVANATAFQTLSTATYGFALQPAVDWGNTTANGAILATALDAPLNNLKRADVQNAGGSGATITSATAISVRPYSIPPGAVQPAKDPLDSGDVRISGNVQAVGTSLWAVHSTTDGGRAAIQWFEIDAATNSLKQSGIIGDAAHDYIYPSIAVNQFGDVVIGFTRTGADEFASSYAVIGDTIGGITTFGAPQLLMAGLAAYQLLDDGGFNRWGDYSATVVDPNDPFTFWTFQEWADLPFTTPSGRLADNWATQITEIRLSAEAVPVPSTLLLLGSGLLSLAGLRRFNRG